MLHLMQNNLQAIMSFFRRRLKKKELSKTSTSCILPTTATIILKSKSDHFLRYYYLFNDYHQPVRQSPSSLEEHIWYRPCQSVHFHFLLLFSQTLSQLSKLRYIRFPHVPFYHLYGLCTHPHHKLELIFQSPIGNIISQCQPHFLNSLCCHHFTFYTKS